MAVVFMTDESLIKALKNGEDLAFEALIDNYGDKLLRLCYLIIKDLSEAEDVVQEVFIQSYKSVKGFKENSSIYTWLYKIALNKCRTKLKKEKDHSPFDENIEIEYDDDVEYEALCNIERTRIKDIVFSLAAPYREVIILFYYEELSLKEICTILDENENTVKSKLHRGRNKIKQKLIEEGLAYEGR